MAVCGLRLVFSPGSLPPVRMKLCFMFGLTVRLFSRTVQRLACGRAVIAGKLFITEFWGGFNTYVSRGAEYDVRDGKTKSWAGKVRPAVVVWRRGRQDADLNRKKRKHGRLRFFLPLCPCLRARAAPPPLSRL